MSRSNIIYKICSRDEWESATREGRFRGSQIDVTDGFIHFSTAAQVRETAAKHFAGQDGLVLIAVAAEQIGEQLKWEPSRGGDIFPHLYSDLPVGAVVNVSQLPIGPDGNHRFPE